MCSDLPQEWLTKKAVGFQALESQGALWRILLVVFHLPQSQLLGVTPHPSRGAGLQDAVDTPGLTGLLDSGGNAFSPVES